jgi:hypothetical protein
MENRIMMRRRLIAELKQDTKKAEAASLKKLYHPEPEPAPVEEVAAPEPEKEISPEELASLVSE